VSLRCAESLAESLGLPWTTQSLTEADLAAADEILLTSTPNCVLPATRFNGRAVGDGRPGTIYQSLVAAWSSLVGLDIRAQARARAESSGSSA
jgi:branched-chain amino acid aminotransferase